MLEPKQTEEQAVPAGADGGKGRFQSSFYDWGEALIVSLIFIVLLFTFVVRLIGVDGSSMFPTLHDMDVMIVSDLGYTPEKGDIVVLNKKSFIDGPIVKRIIATGGDTVDIDFSAGTVMVNGETLDENYIYEPTHLSYDMTFPQIVPEGCVFVLGDNRNGSTDSRASSLGMVDERYIIGHVLAVVWPLDHFGGKTA